MEGLPVHAVCDGIVKQISHNLSWGTLVVIESNNLKTSDSLCTIYGHLSPYLDVNTSDTVTMGDSAEAKTGNILPLKNIPEGTQIYNIELQPGDGGKFVRSSGGFAKVEAKLKGKVSVILPSGTKKLFEEGCRACIGSIAGGGRCEKPFVKAGNKFFAMRSKNKLWPSVSGTSQNAVDHPFGGSSSGIKGCILIIT